MMCMMRMMIMTRVAIFGFRSRYSCEDSGCEPLRHEAPSLPLHPGILKLSNGSIFVLNCGRQVDYTALVKVSFFHPADLPPATLPGKARWIYADASISVLESIQAGLGGEENRYLSPRAFQDAVRSFRDPFVAWVDENLRRSEAEEYLVTPLEKSIYNNDLFLHFCWLNIIDAADSGELIVDELVVVSVYAGLADCVALICRRRGWDYECRSDERLSRTRSVTTVRSIAGVGYHTVMAIWRMLSARIVLGRRWAERLKGVQVLLECYVKRSVEGGKLSQENQLPGLYDYYTSAGIRPAYYPIIFEVPWAEVPVVFSAMKCGDEEYAVVELFLGLTDVGWALRETFHRAFFRDAHYRQYREIDLSPLLITARIRSCLGGFTALLRSRAAARLSAAGVHPGTFISWAENQPVNKASVFGFARLSDPPRMIAQRQWPPLPNLLSLHTTATEVEDGVAPGENWVCGSGQIGGWSRYDEPSRYKAVPALRYAHVFEPFRRDREEKFVLVLLSFVIEECVLIHRRLMEAYGNGRGRMGPVRVRRHPSTPPELINRVIGDDWNGTSIEWARGSLRELLLESRLVISIHSSAIIEALCYGVPAIVIGKHAGLDENPIEFANPVMWRIVYESAELLECVDEWSPRHPLPLPERVAMGTELREEFFMPVTSATMNEFALTRS